MALLHIAGGTVYDPANGIDGEVRDVWIRSGKVVESSISHPLPLSRKAGRGEQEVPDRVIDARGLVVMPGGVDLHSHIAGPTVNAARRLNPGALPSTTMTGRLYAGLGYTTAIDAAIAPTGARHAHLEFADTPIIDKAFLVMLANNGFVLEQIAAGESGRLRDFVGWLLNSVKAYGIKAVNPGGVEMWKQGQPGPNSLDDPVGGFGVTPRRILTGLADAVSELKLPHALHVHCNHLGLPGNASTTLATMHALDGRRAHLTHIQFHSYGGAMSDTRTMSSRVAELADYVNRHENLTVDVGQVVFGDATALTGDTPVGYFLHRATGRRCTLADIEFEAGCGIVPIEYKERSFVHALQWAIGLEWFLLMRDPWRVALTTDHPNGGSFLAYPEIIAWLMSRDLRRSMLDRLPKKVRQRTALADLDREYTLSEIAIITRAAPARILGMKNKGHLGIGADADVTIYSASNDRRAMFALPRFVIKAGQVIVDDGEIRQDHLGTVLHVKPDYDAAVVSDIQHWFDRFASMAMTNVPLHSDDFASPLDK
jgi:formylmethanofuran dehydrogenase subunit A